MKIFENFDIFPKISLKENPHRQIFERTASNDISWSFKVKIDDGLLSCMALPGNGFAQSYWMSYGTQKGMHAIWDIRYQSESNKFQHPQNRGSVKIDLVSSGGPSLGSTMRPGTRLEQIRESEGSSSASGGGGGGFGVAVDLDYAEVDSWNKYLASVSEGVNEINWWNVETGERVACVSANPNDTMESMNSQPDLQEVWIEYV